VGVQFVIYFPARVSRGEKKKKKKELRRKIKIKKARKKKKGPQVTDCQWISFWDAEN
jgi:hypothetical protein